MGTFIDRTGQRFGKLTVIERVPGRTKHGHTAWVCQCDCGKRHTVATTCLKKTKSCGCSAAEFVRQARTKHGKAFSRVYSIWHNMRSRCTNPNSESFPDYGARGISVCQRWLDSFDAFYADMGDPTTADHTLERIDNNGNYEPDNCKWATRLEQGANKRPRSYSWKLTREQAYEIRELKRSGLASRVIAAQFGITRQHVNEIYAGRKWAE